MTTQINLRELSQINAPERAFLNVFLAGPNSVDKLSNKFEKIRRTLKGNGIEKDERQYFNENVKLIEKHLKGNPLTKGGLALFACWALDFFQAVPLNTPINDQIILDSSPYIRPLAEFQDEYENVAVVVADNKKSRIFMVSAGVADDEQTITGNVKNHVKVGGWSQQRYERRRDKQLLLYAREIVDALNKLDHEEKFRRVLLVGGKEILRIIFENLPQALQKKVAQKSVDLGKGEGFINKEIMDLFSEQERASEQDLWEKIRRQFLQGGLGTVGIEAVLGAAKIGRVDSVIVRRDFKSAGIRCRDCEALSVGSIEICPACGSTSVFEVDLVNELVELLKTTGAEIDFCDPIDTLTEAGNIAALLRY